MAADNDAMKALQRGFASTASKTPSTRRCCSNMEQFIGCDAHKKFSVFVAVNEKGQAGEALRGGHDRQLYPEFVERLPAHSAIAVPAAGTGCWRSEWEGCG